MCVETNTIKRLELVAASGASSVVNAQCNDNKSTGHVIRPNIDVEYGLTVRVRCWIQCFGYTSEMRKMFVLSLKHARHRYRERMSRCSYVFGFVVEIELTSCVFMKKIRCWFYVSIWLKTTFSIATFNKENCIHFGTVCYHTDWCHLEKWATLFTDSMFLLTVPLVCDAAHREVCVLDRLHS